VRRTGSGRSSASCAPSRASTTPTSWTCWPAGPRPSASGSPRTRGGWPWSSRAARWRSDPRPAGRRRTRPSGRCCPGSGPSTPTASCTATSPPATCSTAAPKVTRGGGSRTSGSPPWTGSGCVAGPRASSPPSSRGGCGRAPSPTCTRSGASRGGCCTAAPRRRRAGTRCSPSRTASTGGWRRCWHPPARTGQARPGLLRARCPRPAPNARRPRHRGGARRPCPPRPGSRTRRSPPTCRPEPPPSRRPTPGSTSAATPTCRGRGGCAACWRPIRGSRCWPSANPRSSGGSPSATRCGTSSWRSARAGRTAGSASSGRRVWAPRGSRPGSARPSPPPRRSARRRSGGDGAPGVGGRRRRARPRRRRRGRARVVAGVRGPGPGADRVLAVPPFSPAETAVLLGALGAHPIFAPWWHWWSGGRPAQILLRFEALLREDPAQLRALDRALPPETEAERAFAEAAAAEPGALEACGRRFAALSDTEVLPAGAPAGVLAAGSPPTRGWRGPGGTRSSASRSRASSRPSPPSRTRSSGRSRWSIRSSPSRGAGHARLLAHARPEDVTDPELRHARLLVLTFELHAPRERLAVAEAALAHRETPKALQSAVESLFDLGAAGGLGGAGPAALAGGRPGPRGGGGGPDPALPRSPRRSPGVARRRGRPGGAAVGPPGARASWRGRKATSRRRSTGTGRSRCRRRGRTCC
jgi:hypothetical protein